MLLHRPTASSSSTPRQQELARMRWVGGVVTANLCAQDSSTIHIPLFPWL